MEVHTTAFFFFYLFAVQSKLNGICSNIPFYFKRTSTIQTRQHTELKGGLRRCRVNKKNESFVKYTCIKERKSLFLIHIQGVSNLVQKWQLAKFMLGLVRQQLCTEHFIHEVPPTTSVLTVYYISKFLSKGSHHLFSLLNN